VAGTDVELVTTGTGEGDGDGVGVGAVVRVGVGTSQPYDPPESGTVVQPGGSAPAAAVPSRDKQTVDATASSLRLLRLDGVSGGSGQCPKLLRLEPTLAVAWRIEAKS